MSNLGKLLPSLFLLLTLCLLLPILGVVRGKLGELPRQLPRKVQGADNLVVPEGLYQLAFLTRGLHNGDEIEGVLK